MRFDSQQAIPIGGRRLVSSIMSNVAMRIRNTRQLRAIHDVLNGTDRPVSIEEIHRAAKAREPGLGVATVYRTVKALVEAGTVVSIALPGEGPRFELSGKGHHHHF